MNLDREVLWETVNRISKLTERVAEIRNQMSSLKKEETCLEEELEKLLGKKHGNTGFKRFGDVAGPKMMLRDAILEIFKTRFPHPKGASVQQIQKILNEEYRGRVKLGAKAAATMYLMYQQELLARPGKNFFTLPYIQPRQQTEVVQATGEKVEKTAPPGFKLFDIPIRPPQRFTIGSKN
jgi:hypothetical protein